jgi:hypothetical protein
VAFQKVVDERICDEACRSGPLTALRKAAAGLDKVETPKLVTA